MALRIAICEDEKIFYSYIERKAAEFFANKAVETERVIFTDGNKLLDEYNNGKRYDIIFMDIGLECSDGMQVASQIRAFDKRVVLIFITSFGNRAVEGYDVDAFGYVVKNTLEERFPEMLGRLWNELCREKALVVNDKGNVSFIYFDDIYALESSGRGTVIYDCRETVKTNEKLSVISSGLPVEMFIECHKSVFVNISKIKRINANTLTLDNGEDFPVSRRRRSDVVRAVMRRVGGK